MRYGNENESEDELLWFMIECKCLSILLDFLVCDVILIKYLSV